MIDGDGDLLFGWLENFGGLRENWVWSGAGLRGVSRGRRVWHARTVVAVWWRALKMRARSCQSSICLTYGVFYITVWHVFSA